MIDFKELVAAGVHFGHRTAAWCPLMEQYIWGHKNNVHLIDVSKTAFQLEKAAHFIEEIAGQGKFVLWVGTKKAAQQAICDTAQKLGMPYVNHRWIGGTLSNYSQVKKSITKLLHYEDVLKKDISTTFYTKKEINRFRKSVERLKKNIGGITNLKWPLGAIVLVDVNKEMSALKEACSMKIPVVALVDTNSDPTMVSHVIPGNDDAPRSIKLILSYLEQAAQRGIDTAQTARAASGSAQEIDGEEDVVMALGDEDGEEEKSKNKNNRPRSVRRPEGIDHRRRIQKKSVVEG